MMFSGIIDRIDALRAARERALDEHRDWIRQAWPDHVRGFAGRGRVPTSAEIIADGVSLGWEAWGDPSRSRDRYEPIREAFEPLRLADLRSRLEAIR